MDWNKLLIRERFEPYGAGTQPPNAQPGRASDFEDDAQRILSTTAFRRLQGKTQVYPFPARDYMRTRLTHTIEVAHTAHVIGGLIGEFLLKNKKEEIKLEINPADFADILSAAAYSHDLGNPPFGHIGEYAIQSWFNKRYKKGDRKNKFGTGHHLEDFLYFDGNAQGFRIVTRLQAWIGEGGLQLTYPVIGAFCKYPWSSDYCKYYGKPKYGYTHDDSTYAQQIFGDRLGLPIKEVTLDGENYKRYARHPLAYAAEAADDICYLATDIEDGVRAKLVEFEMVEPILLRIAQNEKYAKRYRMKSHKPTSDKIAFLRSAAISALQNHASRAFAENYSVIMDGELEGSLLDNSDFAAELREIRRICEDRIYVDREKMEVEAAGFTVIQGLLDIFSDMIEYVLEYGEDFRSDRRMHNVFQLFPEEFRSRLVARNRYRSFLVLVDYISGMTDRYALELYQKLNGTSVVLGRML